MDIQKAMKELNEYVNKYQRGLAYTLHHMSMSGDYGGYRTLYDYAEHELKMDTKTAEIMLSIGRRYVTRSGDEYKLLLSGDYSVLQLLAMGNNDIEYVRHLEEAHMLDDTMTPAQIKRTMKKKAVKDIINDGEDDPFIYVDIHADDMKEDQ